MRRSWATTAVVVLGVLSVTGSLWAQRGAGRRTAPRVRDTVRWPVGTGGLQEADELAGRPFTIDEVILADQFGISQIQVSPETPLKIAAMEETYRKRVKASEEKHNERQERYREAMQEAMRRRDGRNMTAANRAIVDENRRHDREQMGHYRSLQGDIVKLLPPLDRKYWPVLAMGGLAAATYAEDLNDEQTKKLAEMLRSKADKYSKAKDFTEARALVNQISEWIYSELLSEEQKKSYRKWPNGIRRKGGQPKAKPWDQQAKEAAKDAEKDAAQNTGAAPKVVAKPAAETTPTVTVSLPGIETPTTQPVGAGGW